MTPLTTADAVSIRPRLLWMDFLRGTAVLLVMVNHAIGMAHIAGYEIPEWLMSPTRSVEPFRLPMLLFVSGLLLPRALTKPLGTYVRGKLRHVVWPLVLWAPLVVFAHIPERAAEPLAWIAGPSHLWYLSTLVFCYAVALLSRWVPLWVFPVVFLSLLLGRVSDNVNLLWFGSFFFIGALMQPALERIQSASRWAFLAALAVAVTGSFLHVAQVTSGQSLLILAFALAGVLVMLWLAPRVPRVAPVRWLERLGRRSMVFYVVHLPVIALILRAAEPHDLPAVLVIGVSAVAAVAVPFLLTRVKGHEHLFSFPDLSAPAAPAARRDTDVASGTRELTPAA